MPHCVHVCVCMRVCVRVCVCVTVLPLPSAASRLTNFMKLCCHTGAMNDVAADITLSSEENKTTPDLSHALDKLTQSRLESRLQGRRHFLRSTLQAGVGRLQGVAGVGRPVASAASGGLAPDQLDDLLIVSLTCSGLHLGDQCQRGACCGWEG